MRRLSLLVWLLLALGCGSSDRAPHLIELTGAEPRHLEVGDRMRLTGSGFPEGRPASVTLRGELRRSGELPTTSVNVSADAEQVAPHAVELPVTSELARKLCGGVSARHATFRGDVEIAFTSQSKSGLPVMGRLDGVVIDFVPSERDEAAMQSLRADGLRFARFLGVTLGAAADGLQITAVEPQGRAFRANLSAGDVIRELDGVVVRGASDFIPPPNAKSSLLLLQRGPDSLALRVDSSGYRYSSPDTLLPSLFAIGLLLLVFGVVQSPLGRWLSLFERRLGERLRESRVTASVVRRDVPLWRAFKSLLAQQLPESFLPYLVVVGASSLFSLLSLSKSVIWAELDVVLLPAVTLTGLFVNAFIAGGSGSWTLRCGLGRAFAVLLFNAPFALWIVATAWWAGSLRVSEVVGLQGAFPWQWAVFKSPVLGVLALTSLLARVATVRPSVGLSRREPEPTRQRALSLMAFAHTSCVTGMLALLGFGGYALPFAHTSAPAAALSVALMLGKASLLMLLIAFLRWVFGAIDVVTAARGGFVWLVLPSVAALGLAASFAALGGGPTLATLAQGVPPTAFVASLVLGVWVFARVARAARAPLSSLRIQSWL